MRSKLCLSLVVLTLVACLLPGSGLLAQSLSDKEPLNGLTELSS